jgi:purine-nucleoside phosphorylase
MANDLKETCDFLGTRLKDRPVIGIITGTGLASVTDLMSIDLRISYAAIPHFPRSTSEGHRGNLATGRLAGLPSMALEGRFHLYEGYTPEQITYPVRVMAALGVEYLLISSAAGGLNPLFQPGDLMLVIDHINLTGTNPLVGPNLDSFGPRFPDMSEAYDLSLVALAEKTALESRILLRRGVYAGVLGPSLETPAETRFLRMIGADAVGMSTVSEVIVAAHSGLKTMAIVSITNVNLPDCMEKISIEDVIAAAEKTGASLACLWERIAACLPK